MSGKNQGRAALLRRGWAGRSSLIGDVGRSYSRELTRARPRAAPPDGAPDVIDHVQALKHGGADTPSNMQWQTIEAAKAKDKIE
jgi:hypothetical protein